jgi:hypothetical protein
MTETISDDEDVVVRIQDVRALKLCMSGARVWVAKHDLDWTTFVTQGYPASVFLAKNDGLILPVVAEARRRVARGQR